MENLSMPRIDRIATRRTLLVGLYGLVLSVAVLPSTVGAGDAAAPTPRVVYHIDDAARALPAIRNITNHLKAVPNTKIVVVTLGLGVDFLLKDAKDDRGNPYEPMIDDLVLAGVEFRVCNNTLVARQIDKARVHPDAVHVESGVAEITRLQLSEGYAYLKP
jgi:intracellular sulfur oxidation DsrE/DsrF family protein